MKTIAIFLVATILFSCSKDDTAAVNQAPNVFNVTVTAATKGLAINLSWEAATDPNGDAITYDVYVENTLIAENLTTLAYPFLASAYSTQLTGRVVAKDILGAEQSITFSVTSSSLVDIPDANFEQALINFGTDTDGAINGQITIQDVLATTFLSLNNANVSDLTGIEAFTNLTSLSCSQNNLTALNVSENTSLVTLFCFGNNLNSLNIKNGNNQNFTSFDALGNPNLNAICVDALPVPQIISNGVETGVTFTTNCN